MSLLKSLASALRGAGQALENAGAAIQKTGPELVSKHKSLEAFQRNVPAIDEASFIAPCSSVIGRVTIGKNSSVWYNSIIRGDVNDVVIGENTSIQDGAIIHVAKNNAAGNSLPTKIGNNVTIGHGAIVHAATIEDNSLIGMGAVVMDGAKVEKNSMLGAGSVLSPGKTVPTGQVWAGNPAKFLRNTDPSEMEYILELSKDTAHLATMHQTENAKTHEELVEEEFLIRTGAYRPTEAQRINLGQGKELLKNY